MLGRRVACDDQGMDPDVTTPAYVAASASRLGRAAGELQQWASSPDAVPSLPVALAHVEEALDRLAGSMQLMAASVQRWCSDDEGAVKPEPRALGHQLRAIADTLIDARDACPPACEWARRLVGDDAVEHLRRTAVDTRQPCHRRAIAGDLVPRPRRESAKTGARLHGAPSRRESASEAP